MRLCGLIVYLNNESDYYSDANGILWDNAGITKTVRKVLDENNYSSKIDIVPTQLTCYFLFKNPTAGGKKMSAEEIAYFEGFTFPFLAFYDLDEKRYYGILPTTDAVQYNAVKSAFDVIANTEKYILGKGYEVKLGEQSFFMQDARNAHLKQNDDGQIDPKHSLLDAVEYGSKLGVFDRPYLRDKANELIKAVKKYWWIAVLGIGGYVLYNESQSKRKNTRYLKFIKGTKKELM